MIKLTDDLYIDADANQYILKRKTINKKTGEPVYRAFRWCSTVNGVLMEAGRHELRNLVQSNDMTLKEALSAFRNIEDKFSKLVEM